VLIKNNISQHPCGHDHPHHHRHLACRLQTMDELCCGEEPFKKLESGVKAALTREYNKGVHKSQGLNASLYAVRAPLV
jgi:hypothetical protein